MLDRLQKFFNLDKYLAHLDEMDYLIKEHQYNEPQKIKKAQQIAKSVQTHFLVGAGGGVSLSLSLRRYLPHKFGTFSLNRVTCQAILIMVMSMAGAYVGIEKSEGPIKNLKYDLLNQYDPKYLQFLRQKGKKYHYKHEYTLVSSVFTKSQYKEWKLKLDENLL